MPTTIRSASHRRRLLEDEKAAEATPFSLLFDDDTDTVDFGRTAALLAMLADDHFTVDVYYQSFGQGFNERCAPLGWAAQYDLWSVTFIRYYTTARATFYIRDGFGGNQNLPFNTPAWSDGTWYYIRARRAGNTMYLSVDAAAGVSLGINAGIDLGSAQTLQMSRLLAWQFMKGRICYAHLWDNDQGALGAVPDSPFDVDGNTVARWTFSEGEGATLGDDAGTNHGTIDGAAWSETVPDGWTL